MNRVAFYGTIRTGDNEVVAEMLRKWLKIPALDVKIRLIGAEMTFEDDTIYIYCYLATAAPPGERFFLLEGKMVGTLYEVKVRLLQLMQLCKAQNISCDFEYEEVNEVGNPISEEFHIS